MKELIPSLIGVALAIGVLASSCSSVPGDTAVPKSLDGTSWVLFAYRKTKPIPGTEITAAFEDGQVTGSGGCNTYFGSYEVSGSAISIEGLGSTEMACMDPEGVMEQEQEYLEHLAAASVYQLDGDRLMIYWDKHEALTFEARK